MKINLILHDFCRGWIIEKMAHRLCEGLVEIGANAVVVSAPSVDADVNHFMIFHYVDIHPGTFNTVGITHVDDILKVDMLRQQFKAGMDIGICMSSHTTQQLASEGLPVEKLAFALPASDGRVVPRKIVIGITSNAYNDGRKRESLLGRLASETPLEEFEFQIYGYGWEKVSRQLEAAGALVKQFPGTGDYLTDYDQILEAIPHFDFYLYLGLDEGALGTLDALAAGIPTIVTRQGYHIDIPHGITHGFWDYEELRQIITRIRNDRILRSAGVEALTWRAYAERHMEIWTALCSNAPLPLRDLRATKSADSPRSMPMRGYQSVFFNQYRRNMWSRYWMPQVKSKLKSLPARITRRARRLFDTGLP